MRAFLILRHAVLLVVTNPGAALRVSVAPMVVVALIDWLVTGDAVARFVTPYDFSRPDFRGYLVHALLLALPDAWMSIAWDRHILLGARVGLIPAVHPRAVTRYLPWALWLTVLVSFGIYQPFYIIWLWEGGEPEVWTVPLLVVTTLVLLLLLWWMIWLSLRLPGLSIGARWRPDWPQPVGITRDIAIIAVALFALFMVLTLPLDLLGEDAPLALRLGLGLVREWVSVMLWAAVITTLYGHLVQGRPLR